MSVVLSGQITERFLSKVLVGRFDDCWIWNGSRKRNGYGQFNVRRGQCIGAHRIAWQIANGAVPDDLLVLHSCDNRPCVNPRHLFLGTTTDNMRDASRKGRLRHPHKANRAKHRAAVVRYFSNGDAVASIAADLGVSAMTIRRWVQGVERNAANVFGQPMERTA